MSSTTKEASSAVEDGSRKTDVRAHSIDRTSSVYSRSELPRRSLSPEPTLRSVVVPAENGPFKDGKLIKPLFRPHRFRTLQFNCELCNVQCSSDEVFDMHLRGQKHLKKQKRKEELEKAGLMEKIQESETYCKLCSVELTSKTHMLLHLSGRRHKQNMMKELSAKNEPIAKSTAEVEEFEKKQAEEEEELIKKAGITDFDKYDIPQERKAAALAEGARNEYYCSICTKFFSGKTQLAMHLLSVKHKEKEFPQSRLRRGAASRGGRGRGSYHCTAGDMNSTFPGMNMRYPLSPYGSPYMNTFPMSMRFFRSPMPMAYRSPGGGGMSMPYYPMRTPLMNRSATPFHTPVGPYHSQDPAMQTGYNNSPPMGYNSTFSRTPFGSVPARFDYRQSSPYARPPATMRASWGQSASFNDSAAARGGQTNYWRDSFSSGPASIGSVGMRGANSEAYYDDYNPQQIDNGFDM